MVLSAGGFLFDDARGRCLRMKSRVPCVEVFEGNRHYHLDGQVKGGCSAASGGFCHINLTLFGVGSAAGSHKGSSEQGFFLGARS